MPHPSHLPWLDLPNDIWGWVQAMKFLTVKLPKTQSGYSLSTAVAMRLQVCLNLHCWLQNCITSMHQNASWEAKSFRLPSSSLLLMELIH
jgi:hypothetical protein